jgi:hypothetical protein
MVNVNDNLKKTMLDYKKEGFTAFNDGLDFWQNPHADDLAHRDAFLPWLAGWCDAKQKAAK